MIAERVHGDAGHKIEIGAAFRIEDADALAAVDGEGKAVVSVKHILLGQIDDFLLCHSVSFIARLRTGNPR